MHTNQTFDYQIGTGDNQHETRIARGPDKVSPDCGWEGPEHCLVTRVKFHVMKVCFVGNLAR